MPHRRTTLGFRAAPGVAMLLASLLVTACSAPSPNPTGSGTAGPSPSVPAATPPTAATAQFNLDLGDVPPGTAAVDLVVSVDGAAEVRHPFCGTGPEAPQPCAASERPLTVRIEGIAHDAVLEYRFERVATDGSAEVIAADQAIVDRALVRETTYPPPSASGTPQGTGTG